MGMIDQVSDEINREAGDVIRAVSGKGPRLEVEPHPGFEAIVAGAAKALEKGAPHALYDSRSTPAERWLEDGTNEWRHFHSATALALNNARGKGEIVVSTTEEIMTHIVSDVLTQTGAKRMSMAVADRHPAFSRGLTEQQRDRVEDARDRSHPEERQGIRYESYGAYSQVSGTRQRDLATDFETGRALSTDMRSEIYAIAALIDKDRADLGPINRAADERVADFQEDGKGALFNPVTSKHYDRVEELRGGARPESKVEAAVLTHIQTVPDQGRESIANGARAQALADLDGAWISVPQMAQRIESHRMEVENARTRAYEDIEDPSMPPHVEQMAYFRPSEMDREVQAAFYSNIESRERVNPMMGMELAVLGKSNEDLLMANVDELIRRDKLVTYENITETEAGHYALDLHMPGDRVRFDDKVNIREVDKDAIALTLGLEPLEIRATIVEGTTHSNGMGGESPAVRPSYEFVGHEGRFPAGQFQHERGEDHVYAVVEMRDDRVWLVPMDPKTDPDREPAVAVGAAREITASLVGDSPALEGFKDELKDGPVSGEFVIRPEAYGRTEGPVELVVVPWMSKAWDSEAQVASKVVDAQMDGKAVIGHTVAQRMAMAGMDR